MKIEPGQHSAWRHVKRLEEENAELRDLYKAAVVTITKQENAIEALTHRVDRAERRARQNNLKSHGRSRAVA